jgi:formylglycine-generating enzyme required for sulfatase activity
MCVFAAALVLSASPVIGSLQIPTSPVRNAGNFADPGTGGFHGAVAYIYDIGVTEVTNAQYAVFLNAVARTDLNGLYNASMSGSLGGITRSGAPGSYTYATISGRAERPVNFVSFWDAARFANWLHNGQRTGLQGTNTTEGGAYTLTPSGISLGTVRRNADWRWAIPSSNEWYKAAFHQPALDGGDTDSYWRYPTSSNTINVSQANYLGNGLNGPTSIGQYNTNYYGTFDMAGNVAEWNDTAFGTSNRGVRGGAFNSGFPVIDAGFNVTSGLATNEFSSIGFRVVRVPGPATAACVGLGGLLAARRRR